MVKFVVTYLETSSVHRTLSLPDWELTEGRKFSCTSFYHWVWNRGLAPLHHFLLKELMALIENN
jgi:hypothetical protein